MTHIHRIERDAWAELEECRRIYEDHPECHPIIKWAFRDWMVTYIVLMNDLIKGHKRGIKGTDLVKSS